jgi:putative ABC transport system substrate-binding protein
MPVVGFLTPIVDLPAPGRSAFREGLRETGYVEGQNVSIEYRGTGGRNDPLTASPVAKELVDRRVSVIVATTVPLGIAAKNLTQTIPIVVRAGTDPVAAGLVTSLSRPGANITGISTFSQDLGPKRLEPSWQPPPMTTTPKRLELLAKVVPKLSRVGFLSSPDDPASAPILRAAQVAAPAAGLQLVPHETCKTSRAHLTPWPRSASRLS